VTPSPSHRSESVKHVADGVVRDDVVLFHARALAGYVNRWIPCTAVKLEVAPTGEANIVIRYGDDGMDIPASKDGVHA